MNRMRLAIFVVVALAQLSVPAWAIWERSQTLNHGRLWKFRTEPVDPVDAVRGRYVVLGFVADQVPSTERLPDGSTAYAILKEGMDGFAVVERLTTVNPGGVNVMKVDPGRWYDGKQHVIFPFNRYWVTEKLAPEAERAYADNTAAQKQKAYVTVRVRNGDAALEELFLDDQPLKEYLRANAPSPSTR